MSAEEKTTWLKYQKKPDEKFFVCTFRMDARLPALWLSTAYPEPLFSIKRNFSPKKSNRAWCTDFTYMTLTNGTMRYNCSIIDLYDRSVVASENSSFITSSLVERTLGKVLSSSKAISQNLILHSDKWSQITSAELVQHCRKLGSSQSMSRAGCPYDNAPMERDYNTLKTELIYQHNLDDCKMN